MSGFDLTVWYSDAHLTLAQATEIAQHVGSDWVIFAHEPRFEGFLAELRRRYPDAAPVQIPQGAQWGSLDPFLRTIDDPRPPPMTQTQLREAQNGPPSVWDGHISQQGLFASMSVHWEQAVEVVPQVEALATQFGLSLLDEDGQFREPRHLPTGVQPAILRLSLTLHIKGKPPVLDTTVTEGQSILVHEVVGSRLQAHEAARALAAQRHEIGYRVDDPRCVAQGYALVPVPTGRPASGITIYEVKPRTP